MNPWPHLTNGGAFYGRRVWEESRVYRMAKDINAGVDAGGYAGESAAG